MTSTEYKVEKNQDKKRTREIRRGESRERKRSRGEKREK